MAFYSRRPVELVGVTSREIAHLEFERLATIAWPIFTAIFCFEALVAEPQLKSWQIIFVVGTLSCLLVSVLLVRFLGSLIGFSPLALELLFAPILLGDIIQINVRLASSPQTSFATSHAHFSCVMSTPLSESGDFHNGDFASHTFLHSGSECRTDPNIGGSGSGFNNPSGGAPNWDDQLLDIGLIRATDLDHVSLVISS